MAAPQPLAPWRGKAGRFARGAHAAVLGLAAGLVVSVGAAWGEQPAGFADVDRFVAREMRRAAIPGLAYAVVGNGRVLHMNAFGVAGLDGTRAETSNLNCLVFGAVVAAVCGESYESYLEANAFDRLGSVGLGGRCRDERSPASAARAAAPRGGFGPRH